MTGLHTLGRAVPAYRIIMRRSRTAGDVPGRVPRGGLLAGTLAIAGVTAALVLGLSGAWSAANAFHHDHDDRIEHLHHDG